MFGGREARVVDRINIKCIIEALIVILQLVFWLTNSLFFYG